MNKEKVHLHISTVKSTQDSGFKIAWDLYNESFPCDERRSIVAQNEILKNPVYHFNLIYYNNTFIGFILWWQFSKLSYIEHFAISSNLRGQGYGNLVLSQFAQNRSNTIILEVEPPFSNISKRRIHFYTTLGFKLSEENYMQPALNKNTQPVELLLMSYPNILSKNQIKYFINHCHPLIYKTIE